MSGELVLVTGASGYIALHIVKNLLEAGYQVRGTVRDLQNKQKVKPLHQLCSEAENKLELIEVDLLDAEKWISAVAGCKYVIHTACPVLFDACFGIIPDEESKIQKPTIEGTLNILRAVAATKCVKRVVMTSTNGAISGGFKADTKLYTESDWTDLTDTSLPSYPRAKTMAEKAAWNYMANLQEADRHFELTVLNPCVVLGPLLSDNTTASVQLMSALFTGALKPGSALVAMVDVRDVARAHVIAMTSPEVAGKRHILSCQSVNFVNVLKWLADEFNPRGYNVKVEEDADSEMKDAFYDNSRMVKVLKIEPIEPRKSVVDMVHSMIEKGIITEVCIDNLNGLYA